MPDSKQLCQTANRLAALAGGPNPPKCEIMRIVSAASHGGAGVAAGGACRESSNFRRVSVVVLRHTFSRECSCSPRQAFVRDMSR